MDWTAPCDPNELLVCPYDPVHTVPAKRFQYHIIKCRKNHPEKDFVSCPFNAKHIMLRPDLRHHISRCPDRGEVEKYSIRASEKDSEGFYFKGDTSVPSYGKQHNFQSQEEDWDQDEDEQVARNQKPQLSSLQDHDVRDTLSLNPKEREEMKRNMRGQALRQQINHTTQQTNTDPWPPVQSPRNTIFLHGLKTQQERDTASRGSWNGAGNGRFPESNNLAWRTCGNQNYSKTCDTGSSARSNSLNADMSGRSVNRSSDYNNQHYVADERIRLFAQCSNTAPWDDEGEVSLGTADKELKKQSDLAYQPNLYSDYTASADMGILGSSKVPANHSVSTDTGCELSKYPPLGGVGRAKLVAEARRTNFGMPVKKNVGATAAIGRGRGMLNLYDLNEIFY